jgi:hypothetical protein
VNNKRHHVIVFERYCPSDYSDAASQAISVAKKLRERGPQVELIARQDPGLNPHDEIEGLRVTRLEAGRGEKHRKFRYCWNHCSEPLPRERFWDIQAPQSTRLRGIYLCPDRPASAPPRHIIASLGAGSPAPPQWLDAIFGWLLYFPFAASRLRVNSAPVSLPRITGHRLVTHGRQPIYPGARYSLLEDRARALCTEARNL